MNNRYLNALSELLLAMSKGNMEETLDFAEEICSLAITGVKITEYEEDVAGDFYHYLDEELEEADYCGYEE